MSARRARSRLAALALCAGLAAPVAAGAVERVHLLVVSGLGGEPYYADLFHRWSRDLLEIAHRRLAIPDEQTVYLAEDPAREPGLADGKASRAALLDALAALQRRSAVGDRVVVVLIGHGTAQGAVARFNLPGPDLSPETLDDALDALAGRRVAVILTASASGAFVPVLAAPGRVVISATASGAESQHARFAGFFVDALADDAADADKDRRVSLLEAFRHAARAVEASFAEERRLQTEHARLDDDGDGAGSAEPRRDGGDGAVAARFDLVQPAAAAEGEDPAVAAARLRLRLEARRLVERIERLKRERDTLLDEDYDRRLEALLVELALNRRTWRAEVHQ